MPATSHYHGFDVSLRDELGDGARLPGIDIEIRLAADDTLIETIETTVDGIIPDGATSPDAGTAIYFTATDYPGSRLDQVTAETIEEAYQQAGVRIHLIVEDEYDQPTSESVKVEIWAENLSDATEPLRLIGLAKPGETTTLDFIKGAAGNYRIYFVPADDTGAKSFARVKDAPFLDVTVDSVIEGAGTVTSVDMTVPPALLAVSGGPITGSGAFAIALQTQSANFVFAGPSSGSAAAPTFRSLVAADIPSLNFSKITAGTVPIAQGGTGQITAPAAFNALSPLTTAGDILYFATKGGHTRLAGNSTTAPLFLRSQGDGSFALAPTWANPLTVGFPIASGTNNYVFYQASGNLAQSANFQFDGSNLGINTAPSAALHVLKTTEQLRLSYDASHHLKFTVDSGGSASYDATGSHLFNSNITVGGTGSLYIDHIGAGLVQKSNDGTQWLLKIRDDGTLETEAI